MSRSHSCGAFSLVEGLVVGAILVVVVAVAVPGLGHARIAAAESRCVASIRSAGTLVHSYAAQSQELPPHGAYVHGSLTSDGPMASVMYKDLGVEVPYFRMASLWGEIIADWQGDSVAAATCPSSPPEKRLIRRPIDSASSHGESTYWLSAALFAAPSLWQETIDARESHFKPQRFSAVLYPSNKGLLYEQRVLHINRDVISPLAPTCASSTVGFVDGHAGAKDFRGNAAVRTPFDENSPMPFSHTYRGVLGRDIVE